MSQLHIEGTRAETETHGRSYCEMIVPTKKPLYRHCRSFGDEHTFIAHVASNVSIKVGL